MSILLSLIKGIDMFAVNGDRGQGKTTEGLRWVMEGRSIGVHRVLIVGSEDRKSYLLKDNPGLHYNEVETLDTVRNHTYRPSRNEMEYMMDDMDDFIRSYISKTFQGINLQGFTLTENSISTLMNAENRKIQFQSVSEVEIDPIHKALQERS